MELLVLRHAKSSWSDASLADYDRPLKKRGKRNAVSMGIYLKQQGWLPDIILSSTAVRAASTTRRVLKAMGLPEDLIVWSRDFYHAGPTIWMKALAAQSASRVMIVGHNPGLEDLMDILCGPLPREDDGKLLPTAAVARIQLSGIQAGHGKLLHLQRPRHLASAPTNRA